MDEVGLGAGCDRAVRGSVHADEAGGGLLKQVIRVYCEFSLVSLRKDFQNTCDTLKSLHQL